ncbi:MAG: hypothetical protein HY308_00485 [Gammaproteobacteria bacterium]|nr:hypothetical protein [Gammaproteobacteria bacterium]
MADQGATKVETPSTSARSPLDAKQRLALIDVIDELEAVSSAQAFIACANGSLQNVFPHGGVGCGIGNIADTSVRRYRMLLHNFPREAIDALRQQDGGVDSPLMERWRQLRAPILIEFNGDEEEKLGSDVYRRSHAWLRHVRKYDYRNVAAHGLVDLQGELTSFFCFIRMPERLGDKHVYLLNRLTPHLHVALIRANTTIEDVKAQDAPANPKFELSDRQREILRWLHYGKTNAEIANILGISERNARYHIQEIFAKLNAFNRTQAVAKALALNIIEFG